MLVSPSSPLLLVTDLSAVPSLDNGLRLRMKSLASSILRTQSGFRIGLFHIGPAPLFRIAHKGVEEVGLDSRDNTPLSLNKALKNFVTSCPQDDAGWVMVANPAGIALRSLDHLLPREPITPCQYPAPHIDFLWAPLESNPNLACSGIWAVRRRHLNAVLDGWAAISYGLAVKNQASAKEQDAWAAYVKALPLIKKRFENLEVVAPSIEALPWPRVRRAAYVAISHWPEEEKWPFLQSLYFGTWFGDKTGFMVDLYDP
jgi:hypothetical protein